MPARVRAEQRRRAKALSAKVVKSTEQEHRAQIHQKLYKIQKGRQKGLKKAGRGASIGSTQDLDFALSSLYNFLIDDTIYEYINLYSIN